VQQCQLLPNWSNGAVSDFQRHSQSLPSTKPPTPRPATLPPTPWLATATPPLLSAKGLRCFGLPLTLRRPSVSTPRCQSSPPPTPRHSVCFFPPCPDSSHDPSAQQCSVSHSVLQCKSLHHSAISVLFSCFPCVIPPLFSFCAAVSVISLKCSIGSPLPRCQSLPGATHGAAPAF
jgi:hypothetical protein